MANVRSVNASSGEHLLAGHFAFEEQDKSDFEVKHAVVRVDALEHFDQLVQELGGDPVALMEHAGIPYSSLRKSNAIVSYRGMINLLHNTAEALKCPSFGLQLAARQGGLRVLGPLEVAMRNSQTLSDAYLYCSKHLQTYSPVVQIRIEPAWGASLRAISFDMLLNRIPYQQQAVEHAIALMHHSINSITGRAVRSQEVWFKHEPISSGAAYRRYFGTRVCFNKPINAIFLNASDFDIPLANPSQRLYELATSFIDLQYPSVGNFLSAQVRVAVSRRLALGHCTQTDVASELAIHPRTLQRRLRDEGFSFEAIIDDVRRDIALRYLRQHSVPLIRISTMLGYSEPSVLTRSCYRWFSKSPRKVRAALQDVTNH